MVLALSLGSKVTGEVSWGLAILWMDKILHQLASGLSQLYTYILFIGFHLPPAPNTLFFQGIMSTLYLKRRYLPWKHIPDKKTRILSRGVSQVVGRIRPPAAWRLLGALKVPPTASPSSAPAQAPLGAVSAAMCRHPRRRLAVRSATFHSVTRAARCPLFYPFFGWHTSPKIDY